MCFDYGIIWYGMVWYGSKRLALLVFVQLYHAVEMCIGQFLIVVCALFDGKRCAHGIDGLQPTIKSIISMNGFRYASKEFWDLQDTHLCVYTHRLCHHKTCIVLILENFNSLERIFGKKGNLTDNYLLCSLSSIYLCHFLECYTFIEY